LGKYEGGGHSYNRGSEQREGQLHGPLSTAILGEVHKLTGRLNTSFESALFIAAELGTLGGWTFRRAR
jgi:hypothetical protein